MKLALVADTFPPLRSSGAVQLRDLSREFVRQGHELTVFLPAPDLPRPWMIDYSDGVQVVRLRAPRTKDVNYVRRILGEWLMPYMMVHNLRKSSLATEQWDGVIWYSPSIFHAPMVRVLKRRSNCRGYLIVRDIFPDWAVDVGLLRRGMAYRFLKHVELKQYEVADVIGVQTLGSMKYFESWRSEKSNRHLEVLQNWLDKPAIARCRLRIDETSLAGRKIFVYAGNMGIAQGMDILLDLVDRMQARNDIGFLFVGRGNAAVRLRKDAVARGINNTLFYDEIDPDEIPDLFAQCFAGIVALDTRHKSHNIPGKLITYLQNGLPVFANVNFGNDLVSLIRREKVGEVCENNNLDELEQRLLALISNVDADPQLRSRCVDLYERQFSVSKAVQQLVAALH
jgi:glycosyltransferase involved in cell wall biosynthesis